MEKQELYKLYIEERKSTRELAKILGVSQPTARKMLEEVGIKRRERGEWSPREKGSKLTLKHKNKIGKAMIGNVSWLNAETGKHFNWQKEQVKCDFCGKEIWKKKCHLHFNKHFCDVKCHGKWKSKNLVGEQSPVFSRIEIKCDYCKKSILRRKIEIETKRKHFFCSKSCNGKWKAVNLIGKKVYNWKGGHEPYYGENWRIQRKKARERDNHTCQRCYQKNSRNPDVHHIIPFRLFGIKRYKEANDLRNLICYCRRCHKIMEENGT